MPLTADRVLADADVGREFETRARRGWTGVRRVVVAGFFIAVAGWLVLTVREVDWGNVRHTLLAYPPETLVAASCLAVGGHLVYTTFDLLGRRYTDHALSGWRVVGIAFVSYAFSLNLGAVVGAAGFRFRLYSRFGLTGSEISRILAFSVVTNWLGYVTVAGAVLVSAPDVAWEVWPVAPSVLRVIGLGLLAITAGYLAVCAGSRRRTAHIHRMAVPLPPVRLALVQIAVGSASWLAIGAAVHTLLLGRVPFLTVVAVELLAAIATLVLHIPAGLGVLEAVYLTSLGEVLAPSEILGAIVAFRGLFYLAPLVLAILLYLRFEHGARGIRPRSEVSTAVAVRPARGDNAREFWG